MGALITFPGTAVPLTKDLLREYRVECKGYSARMEPFYRAVSCPTFGSESKALASWRSRKHLAVHWREPNGHERLSVNRTDIDSTGRWKDGITWDDLMRIKSECGFHDRHAIEIYPAAAAVVNVANMRHLWLLNQAPEQLWINDQTEI